MSEGRWSRFTAFLMGEEDATPLALVRIICATTIAVHVTRFLMSGAADVALLPQDRGGLSISYGWFESMGGADVGAIHVVCVVCAVSAVFAALGLFSRWSLVVMWLSFRAISSLNPSARGSYDNLLLDQVFLLLFSGCGRALSLDARYRGKGGLATRWPRVLLIVQLTLLYLGSGIGKASSTWVPGGEASALWFILQQPTWARFPGLPLWTYPITQVATTTTWLFEVSGPLFGFAVLLEQSAPRRRWLQRAKRLFARIHFVEAYLALGFMLHVGIELTMQVGPFSMASLALYPAALGPERIDKIGGWLRRRFAGGGPPEPAEVSA